MSEENVSLNAAVSAVEPVAETIAAETTVAQDVAVAAPETETAVSTDQTPEQKAEKDKHEHQNKVQKRIDKLTAEKYQLKGRIEALEKMMQQSSAPRPEDQEPIRENFNDDLSFLMARQDFHLNKNLQQLRKQEVQNTQSSWAEKENKIRSDIPDYDDVIEEASDVMIPQPAVDAILSSDMGPELRYHLAKNPADAIRLSRYTNPVDQIRFIGQIEAKLEISKRKPVPKPTAAPKPIAPVGGGAGPAEFDPAKLNDEEWFAWRKKEKLKKAGIKI